MDDVTEKPDNRLNAAIKDLGLDQKEVKQAPAMLNVLTASRKTKRTRDSGEGPKTLHNSYEFALPPSRDAQGQLMQEFRVQMELGEIRGGYFVEFGATNGITMSNNHMLEKVYDESGLVAEPNPVFHERLGQERDCRISHERVYSRAGEQVPFLCTEKGLFSRMGDINPEDHNEDKMRQNPDEIRVDTISLDDLLDEHGAPDTIDYMSVDTDGSEPEIREAFDFDKRFVKTFTVEHNFTPMRRAIHELMTSRGYVRRFPEYEYVNDWYVHRDVLGR